MRVASVPALHPESERPVDLGHTNSHVHTVTVVQIALEGAGLDRGKERILNVHSDLIEARTALANVDLASALERQVSTFQL